MRHAVRYSGMRVLLSSLSIAFGCSTFAQLDAAQVERLARLNCELSNAWTISNISPWSFPIGGKDTPCYTSNLFCAKTVHGRGSNEGVSLFFFEEAVSDSVEAYFLPDLITTYEFIYTKSFVVVVSSFSSNGKHYDMYTREMLKELRNYFTNWHTSY
jgi:hypothetical protein